MEAPEYRSLYRGIVKSNTGTGSEGGRCKIFVPGVYPNQYIDNANALPWAEPIAPLFGGSYNGENNAITKKKIPTGICGWPNVEAHVWVFFELGDHMKPVYFGAIQGVPGWSAETNKQWVIQSDRYKLVVDEETENDRLTITVEGNVVINVDGNVTQTITGNVTEVIGGDVDRSIAGNVTESIKGDVKRTITGNVTEIIKGDVAENVIGSKTDISTGPHTVGGSPLILNG